jgi:hypothetical protein
MTKNLLLVTGDAGFADGMQQGIGQAGYRLLIASTWAKPLFYRGRGLFRRSPRSGHRRTSVIEIGRALRTVKPTVNLILFSDADTPPALDEIRPWALMRKPSHLPELLNMLNNKPFQPKPSQTGGNPPSVSDELPWLSDVTKAAQHLTRLTLESSAQAALITRRHNLWAYAGQLSQDAAKELATTVTRHWDGQKGSDLLRFVRLEATKSRAHALRHAPRGRRGAGARLRRGDPVQHHPHAGGTAREPSFLAGTDRGGGTAREAGPASGFV